MSSPLPPNSTPSSLTSAATSTRRVVDVLVVEDDALWRRIIRHTLTKRGDVRLVEVDSVAEALDALRAIQFDIVFVDYELPDGCGLDLLNSIDRAKFGRLVLASGFVDPQDLGDERAVHVDMFLTKPFMSTDLAGCLNGLESLHQNHHSVRNETNYQPIERR